LCAFPFSSFSPVMKQLFRRPFKMAGDKIDQDRPGLCRGAGIARRGGRAARSSTITGDLIQPMPVLSASRRNALQIPCWQTE